MTLLWKLAFRNIRLHKKRSFISLAAIAVGLGALIFLRGFMFGAQSQMVQNITATLTSDAQIVPSALEDFYNTNGAIEDPDKVREILKADPRIAAFSERIIGGGMISSEQRSMATFIIGFDPEAEAKIKTRREIMRGRALTAQDGKGVVIGEKMRQALGAEVGETIVLTAQDFYGSLTGGSFTLVGTFLTGNDQLDNTMAVILKSTAQDLLVFEHRISKFALKIDPRFPIQEVTHSIKEKLEGSDLRVVTWESLIPMFAGMIRFQNGMIFVIMAIVLSIVAAGILNTLMMSIMERIRELGLMLALGTQPRQIVILVILESLILSVAGAVTGALLGIGLVTFFGRIGIDLTRFVTALTNLMIGSHVFPRFDFSYSLIFVGAVLGANLLVSFFPAWRAGRLVPLEAMRRQMG
jgi:ABC-type lipoprotein release transport system permease subunit